ncbi:hypothetical protein GF389_01530 [Candidatus Dojkabacteria bacterium]|nr:hypothetical protein [Candidatus Dojkabacteria bacterium]
METIEVAKSPIDTVEDTIFGKSYGERAGAFAWGGASTVAAAIGSSISTSVLVIGVPAGIAGHFLFGKRFLTEKDTLSNPDIKSAITRESLSGLIRRKIYGEKGGHAFSAGFGTGAIIGGSLFGIPGVVVGGLGAGLANGLLNYKGLSGKSEKIN